MTKKEVEANINKTVNSGFSKAKEAVKETNERIYKTTEEVVDFSIKRGSVWQSVSEKAIKGGLQLAANQQDLIFDTLEVFKKQIVGGSKRFSQLFSKN